MSFDNFIIDSIIEKATPETWVVLPNARAVSRIKHSYIHTVGDAILPNFIDFGSFIKLHASKHVIQPHLALIKLHLLHVLNANDPFDIEHFASIFESVLTDAKQFLFINNEVSQFFKKYEEYLEDDVTLIDHKYDKTKVIETVRFIVNELIFGNETLYDFVFFKEAALKKPFTDAHLLFIDQGDMPKYQINWLQNNLVAARVDILKENHKHTLNDINNFTDFNPSYLVLNNAKTHVFEHSPTSWPVWTELKVVNLSNALTFLSHTLTQQTSTQVLIGNNLDLLQFINHSGQLYDQINVSEGFPFKISIVYSWLVELEKAKSWNLDLQINFLLHIKAWAPNLLNNKDWDTLYFHFNGRFSDPTHLNYIIHSTGIFEPLNIERPTPDDFINWLQILSKRIKIPDFELAAISALEELKNDLRIIDIWGKTNSETLFFTILKWASSYKITIKTNNNAPIQVSGLLETRLLQPDQVLLINFDETKHKAEIKGLLPSFFMNVGKTGYMHYIKSLYEYHYIKMILKCKAVYQVTYSVNKQPKSINRFELFYSITQPTLFKTIYISNEESGDKLTEKKWIKNEYIENKIISFFDNNITYSAIDSTNECDRKFVFNSILKYKNKYLFEDALNNRFYGEIVHSVLERLLQKLHVEPFALKELYSNIKIKVDEVLATRNLNNSGFSAINYELIAFLVLKTVQKTLNFHQLPSYFLLEQMLENIKVERNNEVFYLKGIIDRVDIYEHEINIIDYKTGKPVNPKLKSSKDEFLNKTALQLAWYLVLLNEYLPENEKSKQMQLFIYSISGQQKQVLNNPKNEIFDAFFDFLSHKKNYYLKEILEFKCTIDTKRCRTCDFKDLCLR